jgi:hypothetical protein
MSEKKNPHISNFTKIRPEGTEFVPCGQTDRHDEADSRFPQIYVNAPNYDSFVPQNKIGYQYPVKRTGQTEQSDVGSIYLQEPSSYLAQNTCYIGWRRSHLTF